jgi:hypothetical protein
MKKPTRRKATATRRKSRPQTLPRSPSRTAWSSLRRLLAGLGGLATLLGAFAAAISFLPRMTVEASSLFDDSNAYSVSFNVTNTGFIPLRNVQVGVGVCDLQTEKDDFKAINICKPPREMPRLVLSLPRWTTPELAKDVKFAVTLSEALNIPTDKYRAEHPNVIGGYQMMSKLKGADVIVMVHYRPWFMWWRLEEDFRFVAEKQPNEKMMWRPVPLDWNSARLE